MRRSRRREIWGDGTSLISTMMVFTQLCVFDKYWEAVGQKSDYC